MSQADDDGAPRSPFRRHLGDGPRADVHAKSASGTYDGEHSCRNKTLCTQRDVCSWRGEAPASQVYDLMGWMCAVDKDGATFIVLKQTSTHKHP